MAWARDLPHSYRDAIIAAREILSRNHDLIRQGLVDPEADRIVGEVSGLSRMQLVTRIDDRISEVHGAEVIRIASARAQGEVLQYLTGKQTFLNHEFVVKPGVLVPRPETEILVAKAIEVLEDPEFGFEIGVGSGIIAIELLSHFEGLRMMATEISQAARSLALENAVGILGPGVSRLRILEAKKGEVFESFPMGLKADFIISNPPYLIKGEATPDVAAKEPAEALFAPEEDPIYFYRAVAERGADLLKPGGAVLMEIPHERASQIQKFFESSGWSIQLINDLTDRPRVLIGRKSNG